MSRPGSPGPAKKRIKLDDFPTNVTVDSPTTLEEPMLTGDSEMTVEDGDKTIGEAEDDENNCSICLHSIVDRTVVPKCSHEFCFECLLVWTEQSRRCPLCSQAIGDYLIHSIRSRYDYRKHYLSPLRTSPPPSRPAQIISTRQAARRNARRRYRDVEWGTRAREHEEFDKLERSILKRRWIYEHDLYAKHVASNPFTKYRPYPTPSQFAASQELISRTTTFLRRELQVWESLDVEFLTNLIISLMKAIDIRSESAVKLIAEFLDLDAPYTPGGRHVNAEHFAHEVYCYVRSPYRDLFVYDKVVQYDLPPNIPPPPELERSRRWHPPSPSSSRPIAESSQTDTRRHRSKSRSSERSGSWSPSGRRYSPSRNRETFVAPDTSRRKGDGDNCRRVLNNDTSQDKEHKHRINPSADEILDDAQAETYGHTTSSNPSSSEGLVKPSFLTRNNHVSVEKTRRDVKGKGRAHESIAVELAPAVEHLESTLNAVEPNDAGHSPEETPTCDRPSIPRSSLKPPRNNSLLDSVKAHLARNADLNINANTNPHRMCGRSLHQHSANTKSSSATAEPASATSYPISRDQSSNTTTPPSTTSQVPSLSSGFREEETHSVEISRVGRQSSNDVRSKKNLRGGNPSDESDLPPSISLEQIELSATGANNLKTPQIASLSQHDGTVNSGNDVVRVNTITDAPVVAKSSRLEDLTHQASLGTPLSSTRDVQAPVSNSHYSALGPEDKSRFTPEIHHDVSQLSNMAVFPIRKDAYIDTGSASITPLANQSAIPRVTESNARTRLLARLAHEKKQAASAFASPALIEIPGAEPRVLGDHPPRSSLASTLVNVADDKAFGGTATDVSINQNALADLNTGSAGEDVKAREATLRVRVQLKARLAAEKRKLGGGS